ncbi:conserved protein of unknown function [Pararobbsia alpina]
MRQLRSRYEQTYSGPLLTSEDMESWTEIVGSTRRNAYDAMGRHLAIGFHEGRLPFWFCDAVAIAVIRFAYEDLSTSGEDAWPPLFSEVYLAFDAGELGPPGTDPIEDHTRPMIAKIVHMLGSNAS